MIKKITIDKDTLPIDLQVEFKIFAKHYTLVKKQKQASSIEKLTLYMLPTFYKWDHAYVNNIYSDITIYTLFRLLEADTTFKKGLKSLLYYFNLYLLKNNLTFLDIIFDSFFNHINKDHDYIAKKYTNEKTLLFFIANDIKMFIFTAMRSFAAQVRREPLYNNQNQSHINENFYYEDFYYIDYDLLDTLEEPLYRAYFANSLLGDYSPQKDKNFKSTKQSFEHKDTLCHLIKQMPLSN